MHGINIHWILLILFGMGGGGHDDPQNVFEMFLTIVLKRLGGGS